MNQHLIQEETENPKIHNGAEIALAEIKAIEDYQNIIRGKWYENT